MTQIINAAFGLGLSPLDCLFIDGAIFPAFLILISVFMFASDLLARRRLARRIARYRAEARAARIANELEHAVSVALGL